QDYALRSIGIGERLLPKGEMTHCEQFTQIGSGLILILYYGAVALIIGFFLANTLAVAKASGNIWARKPAEWFIFVFRGSPLFIQFFLAYEAFVLIPRMGWDIPLAFMTVTVETSWLSKAWLGALIVLGLETGADSGAKFDGPPRSTRRGDIEAAVANGVSSWSRFRSIMWPTVLRLAWPAYTHEAIFLFHATTLVYFSGF